MSRQHLLHESSGRVRSRMGGAFVGSHTIFRGHDLHAELKDLDWVELYVFGITGRRLTPQHLRLLHGIWVYTSYPDARIWNNRVAALAGSTRSTGNLGVAAALAVSEASIYGRGIDIRVATFLASTQRRMHHGGSLEACVREELATHRGVAGYGRPIASGDERIEPTLALAREVGMADGPHVLLAREVERFLIEGRWRWRMNYGALAAALAMDLGLSPREYYHFMFPAFLAGMTPCFIEATERPPGATVPISCDHVSYAGRAKRTWPNTIL
jgi:hypothetical protein